MGIGRGRWAIAAGIAVLLCGALATAGAAQSIFVEIGGLKATFGAKIGPKALPRSERVPISAVLSSRVDSTDGTPPPAMRQATIGIDRSIAIDSRDVPVCGASQLESQTTEGAEAACPAALVGSGSIAAEIAFPGNSAYRASGRLLAFNGGTAGGTTTVLLQAYLSGPVPQALVVPISLTRVAKGGYGLRAFAEIPEIAGGAGSLIEFRLGIRRLVPTTAGGRHGYLLGRCSDGNFVFAPKVEFADGRGADGLLAVGCEREGRPRGG